MRKRLISICIIGILLFGIYKYVQNKETSLIASHEADIEDIVEGSSENAEPIYIIQPQFTQDNTYEMQDWQVAYAEYIESVEYAPYNKYALIYVDEDDIPELVINTNTYATACTVLTFHDGEVDALQTWSLQCNYIEKKNLYWDAGGHMGEFYDQVYTIENGKWVHAAGGEYIAKELLIEEYDFAWEGKLVTEDEYYENLYAVYDIEKNQNVGSEQYERLDEMLFRLKTGTAMAQTHWYELYVEDVTWDEAQRRCGEKGGYLAAITTIEEYERIKKGIEGSGQTQAAFWVGASADSDYTYWWYEPKRDYKKHLLVSGTIMQQYWADDEPSYYMQQHDEQFDELGVYLLYDDAKENCYLYDAPMDMLLRNPEYKGKIGYICEYDSVAVISKVTYYNADGSIDYWKENEYDIAGNPTKEIMYGDDGSRFLVTEYEYDSRGNKTKETVYHPGDEAHGQTEWEYDHMGNLTKYMEYRRGELLDWTECEYKYITITPRNEMTISN